MEKKRRQTTAAAPSGLNKYFWLKIDMPSVLLIIDTTIADRNHKSTETLMNYHFQPVKGQTSNTPGQGIFIYDFTKQDSFDLFYPFRKSNIWECNHEINFFLKKLEKWDLCLLFFNMNSNLISKQNCCLKLNENLVFTAIMIHVSL